MRENIGSSTRRRNFLAGTSLVVTGAALSRRGTATTQSVEPSVTIEDQESGGRSVTIARAATTADSFVVVLDADGNFLTDVSTRLEMDPGDVVENETIRLTETLTETQQLTAVLSESNAGVLARDTATVTVTGEPWQVVDGLEPRLVDADPDAGFNYPYFLYAPQTYSDEGSKPLLVQPNNTGTATDDFDRHLNAARERIEGGVGRTIADSLPAPFLVPVFPRPSSTPVDGTHYVHQLDDTTMGIESGPLERVDLQLLAMVDHARNILAGESYPVADQIMLNGYSAAGNFVNRFAALHPDEVLSVTGGGINGMAILPIAEDKGHTLPYHIGIADVEELTGEPFDLDAFREVNQFLHMGALDSNDTIPFDDAWTDDDLRQTALDVYGEDMQDDRLPYSKLVYDEVGAAAVFRLYDGAGHTPRPAIDDVVEFHHRSLAGDDIEAIRSDLGGNVPNPRANIVYAPQYPAVGEQVAFDATRSKIWNREIVEYQWTFDSDDTASGELATHTFDTAGGHNVSLIVTDDAGESYRATEQVVVEREENRTVAQRDASTDRIQTDGNSTADGTQSVTPLGYKLFALAGGFAGFGSLGYVALKHFSASDDDSSREN